MRYSEEKLKKARNTYEEVAPSEKYLKEIRRGGKMIWSVEYMNHFEEEVEKKFRSVHFVK